MISLNWNKNIIMLKIVSSSVSNILTDLIDRWKKGLLTQKVLTAILTHFYDGVLV
jgi:hypothetical protein